MTVPNFQNLEQLGSVRAKLNAAIDAVNSFQAGGVPFELEWEGVFDFNFSIITIPASAMTFFPDGATYTAQGCWIDYLDLEEDRDEEESVTHLNFKTLTGVADYLDLYDFYYVESLEFPELTLIGDDFYLEDFKNLETLEFPKLVAVGDEMGFNYNDSLKTVSAPELERVGELYFYENYELETINFPKLEYLGDLELQYAYSMTELTFPALKRIVYELDINDCPDLQSLTFPAIEVMGELDIDDGGMDSLTHFRYGPDLKEVRGSQDFSSAHLDTESIDHILVALAALDGTNGTTVFEDHSVYLGESNSYPSEVGLAAMQVLEERSNYVEINFPPEIVFTPYQQLFSYTGIGALAGTLSLYETPEGTASIEYTLVDNGKGNFELDEGDDTRVLVAGELSDGRWLEVEAVVRDGDSNVIAEFFSAFYVDVTFVPRILINGNWTIWIWSGDHPPGSLVGNLTVGWPLPEDADHIEYTILNDMENNYLLDEADSSRLLVGSNLNAFEWWIEVQAEIFDEGDTLLETHIAYILVYAE